MVSRDLKSSVASAALARIEALLAKGAPWEAIDAFRDARATQGDDATLNYWGALAHARAGAGREALGLLDRARAASPSTDLLHEILCLSGRLAKDRAWGSLDPALLAQSRDDYLAAHALRGDAYPGVNAASLSMLLGDRETSIALASAVVADLEPRTTRTAWDDASLGEALVLLGRVDAARTHYATAAARERGHAGTVASMRRQLLLLGRVLPDALAVLDALPAATVLAFSGHMIDRPDRADPRFPPSLEPAVAAAIREQLAGLGDAIVYTSAACGGDLLFIEAALAIGAEVNVVLPFARDEFVGTSVAFAGPSWVDRFDRALAGATRVVLATGESHLDDDVLFDHALQLVEGLAFTRAAQLETKASLLCVLDGASAARVGGTRAAFDRWVVEGGTPQVIDLAALRAAAPVAIARAPSPTPSRSPLQPHPSRPHRTIKTMLFADIAGFGRVHDALAPLFQTRFLEVVSSELAACAVPPLAVNTWGDALYAVFESPEDGTAFALGLRDRMATVDWVDAGLSESSRLRIALHAGPVFCGFDPVLGRDNYFGASVTTAARIEPVTPPGAIYASEAFVATLAARRPTRFKFDYVGVLGLAKQYGEWRLYVLEHADA